MEQVEKTTLFFIKRRISVKNRGEKHPRGFSWASGRFLDLPSVIAVSGENGDDSDEKIRSIK